MISRLLTPFTDNVVSRVDGLVFKTGKNVPEEFAWYQAYKHKSDIPHIVGIHDHSLVMTFIERAGELDEIAIVETVGQYRRYPKLNNLGFETYINRIADHLKENDDITNGDILLEKLCDIDLPPTFAHGDLSTSNIIPSLSGLKLIDPLYSKTKFGSYILDYAKLLFSLKFYNNDPKSFHELKRIINIPEIDVLVAAESVRVATYKRQFSFISENLINEL